MTEDILPEPNPNHATVGAGFLADKLARHAEPSPAGAWHQLEQHLEARPRRWRPLGFWLLAGLLVALPLALWQWKNVSTVAPLLATTPPGLAERPSPRQAADSLIAPKAGKQTAGVPSRPNANVPAQTSKTPMASLRQPSATALPLAGKHVPEAHDLVTERSASRQVAHASGRSAPRSLHGHADGLSQGISSPAGTLGQSGAAAAGTPGPGLSGLGGMRGMVALRSTRTERRTTHRNPSHEAAPSPQPKAGRGAATPSVAAHAEAEGPSTSTGSNAPSGSGAGSGTGSGSAEGTSTGAQSSSVTLAQNNGSAASAPTEASTTAAPTPGTGMPVLGKDTGISDSAAQPALHLAPNVDSQPQTVTPTAPKPKARTWQIGVVAGVGAWQQQAELPSNTTQPDAITRMRITNLETGPVFNLGAYLRKPLASRLMLELRLAVRYAGQTLTMHHLPGASAPMTYSQVGLTVLAMPPATVEQVLERKLVLPAVAVQVSYDLTAKLALTAGAGLQANLATGQIADASRLPWVSPMLTAGLRRQLTGKLALGVQASFFNWSQGALPTLSDSRSSNQLGLINLEYGF